MKIKRKELYGLLYVVVAFFLAVLIALNYFAFSYSTLVSNFFHQSAFRIEADENAGSENTNYFNLDYTSSEQLEADERAYAEEVQSEGVILLQNNGLPVEPARTTFLGIYSRDDMLSAGVSVSDNAPSMEQQFTDAGFAVNPTILTRSEGLREGKERTSRCAPYH